MAASIMLTPRQARIAWLTRQSLTSPARGGSIASVVGSIGWIPIVSGASAYLALHARGAIKARNELDAAGFARDELTVAPGPRGLNWLVPTADAPLARAFAMADHTSRESRVASACNLTARDLQSTRETLKRVLASPHTPAQLRLELGSDAMRPLGNGGRRAGVATLAGLVLRGMWIQGEVERVNTEARFDKEHLRYGIDPQPRVVPSAAEAINVVASRWLAAHAPASAKDFAAAFDIAASRAAAALKPLHPIEVSVEGLSDVLLAPPDFEAPVLRDDAPTVSFLGAEDGLPHARTGLVGLATPEVAQALLLRHVGFGPMVLVDGEAVAAWSWSPPRAEVRPLTVISADLREAIEARSVAVSDFLTRELSEAALHDGRPPRGGVSLAGEIHAEQ